MQQTFKIRCYNMSNVQFFVAQYTFCIVSACIKSYLNIHFLLPQQPGTLYEILTLLGKNDLHPILHGFQEFFRFNPIIKQKGISNWNYCNLLNLQKIFRLLLILVAMTISIYYRESLIILNYIVMNSTHNIQMVSKFRIFYLFE